MSQPGFVADDEIRESLRVIERQRAGKRIAVLVGMVVALFALLIAVMIGYSDREGMEVTPQTSGGR
jgi:hypothetical protein